MTERVVPVKHESLVDTDEALAAMMQRLRQILAGPLMQDGFVEITAIYNNVAYIFLYLESNEVHVDYERLLPWRRAFYNDPELDARILAALHTLRCTDAEVEQSRQAYVAHLEARPADPEPAGVSAGEALLAREKELLAETEEQQRALLTRLGVSAGGRAGAVFYKLASGTADATARAKLSAAWTRVRDRNLPELVELVDEMIAVRRREARSRGHDSVLAQTLTRCRVDEETATGYLDRYLRRALASHRALAEEIHQQLGTSGDAMVHFGYYIRDVLGTAPVPTFELDDCLAFAFTAVEHAFGLVLKRRPATSPHVLTVDAELDGRHVGQITFDLWDDARKPRSANTTRGVRNRTEWGDIVQYPVAYVSCRFRRDDQDKARINFQNVHSLFHEFGHAVNHLLIRRRLPNQSGLEYLPLERLENLSMWFEKWVYHPDLARHLTADETNARGLALAQQVKMLEYRRTHVDRAVTAALDFNVHRRAQGGLRESFAELDERLQISEFCGLGDFPMYFTWPMFQANPGGNFAYLWGAADSAAKFAPFLDRPVASGIPPAEVREMFASCFDFDLPSELPDAAAVFRFYDRPAAVPVGFRAS